MTYLRTYLLNLNLLSLHSVSIYYMESVTTILRVYSHNTHRFLVMVIFSLYKVFLKNNDTALIMCESKPIFIPFYFILFLSEKR